jgi:MEMO1 family protein
MKLRKVLLQLVFLFVFSNLIFGIENIMVSNLSGIWYPSQRSQLNDDLDNYFNNAKEKKLENVIALILPHAGYSYSGQTAAYGVKEIVGENYSRVIIIGPSHYYQLKNKISVPSYAKIKTPMGEVEIDKSFIDKMLNVMPYAVVNDLSHINEHSIQIQLPMLQKALGDFKLVPIIVGDISDTVAKNIGRILKSCIDDRTLIIVSSDFTHYGERFHYVPFLKTPQTAEKLTKLDMEAVRCIENKDPAAFYNYVTGKKITICGKNPIVILLNMLPKGSTPFFLHYDTSGRQLNNYENSVSYVAMAVTGKWNTGKVKRNSRIELFTDADKKSLLSLARKTIVYYLEEKKMPSPKELGVKITLNMERKMGCFVSLYELGRLRGCIGEMKATRPLYEVVMSQAVNAAVNDYRFLPVTKRDMSKLVIDISVLTPPKKVNSYKDIVIGKDGMTITKNGHFAVFLPQVASKEGGDLEETLSFLSIKAGLPKNAWKKDADFTVFQVILFRERAALYKK